jgi:hypothetical protein
MRCQQNLVKGFVEGFQICVCTGQGHASEFLSASWEKGFDTSILRRARIDPDSSILSHVRFLRLSRKANRVRDGWMGGWVSYELKLGQKQKNLEAWLDLLGAAFPNGWEKGDW